MNPDQLRQLKIDSTSKRRSSTAMWLIFLGVVALMAVAAWFIGPGRGDQRTKVLSQREVAVEKADAALKARSSAGSTGPNSSAPTAPVASRSPASSTPGVSSPGSPAEGAALKASGYIVNRERIELSPRFMGVVKWIGVRKGDSVTNNQVVVQLDDSEYQARMAELEGQIAVNQVAIDKATMDLKRAEDLVSRQVEMRKVLDDARLQLASAEAQLKQLNGTRKSIQTWIDWCTIRSPVNGVVLERMVDPNELVTPQAFGTGRGPSTSLLAVADTSDLQVEVDLNESDLAKVVQGQKCRITPEAYRDHHYQGVVAEIAPEASRQKGTLQVKVRILQPDRYLTPELSAEVEFLK